VRDEAGVAGFVKPVFDRPRIERPTRLQSPVESRAVDPILHQPSDGGALDRFPQQNILRQPFRHVRGSGSDPTPYRIGPSERIHRRSIFHGRYYHRNLRVPHADREPAY
jgi:hypothetical protein